MPTPIFNDVQDPTAALQAGFGSRIGFGRWVRFSMKSLDFKMSTAPDTITVPGNAGEIAFCHLGETILLQVNTISGFTIGGSGTSIAVIFRMPEGWAFRTRNQVGGGNLSFRHISPGGSAISAGTPSQGFIEVGRYGPNHIALFRDIVGTAWANGSASFFGQAFYESFTDGQQ